MIKRLYRHKLERTLHVKHDSTKLLIEDILGGRKPSYVYEILHVDETNIVFNYTYDDWDFIIPVTCQLIGDTYWLVHA